MNQSEERRLAARIEEEQMIIAQNLVRLDQLLEEVAQIRAEMQLAIERVKALGSMRG